MFYYTVNYIKNYRFPPTLGAAFCTFFAALVLGTFFGLGGATVFFDALVAFFCSLAALKITQTIKR